MLYRSHVRDPIRIWFDWVKHTILRCSSLSSMQESKSYGYSFHPLSSLAYVTRSCVILSRQTDNTRILARFTTTRLNTYMCRYKPQLKVENDVPFSLVIPVEIELCPHEIRAVRRVVKNTTRPSRVPVCRHKPWVVLIVLESLISTWFGIS